MSAWSLEKLLAGLHGEIEMRLQRSRAAIGHPVAKGDATEGIWIELLTNYLPQRYRGGKGVRHRQQRHDEPTARYRRL
jgi:hypothetical protein